MTNKIKDKILMNIKHQNIKIGELFFALSNLVWYLPRIFECVQNSSTWTILSAIIHSAKNHDYAKMYR